MKFNDKDRLFRKGLAAFNSRQFYEAHEHWEEVWLETPNPEKAFLQGLIQIAAAFHHHSRANRKGTQNLLAAGLAKIELFPSVHREINVEGLRVAVCGWLQTLKDGETAEKNEIPLIEFVGAIRKLSE
jgi:predicted metal-dependent hydrolase